ncbi:TPA: PBECR4 domain-containing protein, partial [Streptococcus suis]
EQTQEQEKNAEGTIGDFPDKQEAAPLPEATQSQPLNDLSPNQTQPQPLLYFSINEERKSIKKRGYHPASDNELVKLNRYSSSLREAAQWYLSEVSDSTIHYIYKDNEGVNSLQVSFDKDKFIHLTGIFPYKEGYSADKLLIDIANGQGTFDDILLANKGAAFDKLKVLPELPAIIEARSFYFDDLSDVPKLHSLDMDKAIKSGDEDIVLALRTVDGETFPASLMKLRSGLHTQLNNAKEKTILGIYRERDGLIKELDINKEYVKDGGKEFLTILQNRQLEPVITQEEPSLQERFTSVLDGVKELGFDLFKDRNEEEFKLFHQLYEQNRNDLNQTVMAALKQDLVDINSNFFAEWKDDFLYQEKGISSVDVLNGNLTKEEYEAQVSALIEEKSQPQQSLAELLESKDSQALFNHLKEGMKEYANSDKYKQFLQAISKFHDYSIYNVHMMLSQKPDISLVASYQKWKTDFDRQVQKGEKGIKIWVPMTFKEKDKNGQPVLDANGQEKIITRFKLGTVFDVSQTAGKEIPKPVYNLENGVTNYQDIYRAARHVSQENGVKISFQPIDSEANGYYHIEKKEIVIADKKMSEAQILKTLFHEMAHSELHHLKDGFNSSERELQAESIAYVVANHFGIDTSEYSFAYLHNWSLDKQGYEDLENQLKVVQAESKSLINRIDKSLELVKNKSLTNNKLQSKIAQVKQKQEQEKQLKSSEVKQEKSKKQQPTPKEL